MRVYELEVNKMDSAILLSQGLPVLKADKSRAPYLGTLAFMSMLWCIPTVLTLIQVDSALIAIATGSVAAITCGLMMWRPFNALLGLPFFALLAPVGGFIELLGVRAVLTDWLMIVLVGQALYLTVVRLNVPRSGGRRNSASRYFLPLTVVFLLSYAFNFLLENTFTGIPLYYLSSFVLIYFYFNRYARTESEWHAILWAWTLAALLGSLILIRAFVSGEPLINFATDDDVLIDRASTQGVFRATYYYAGFHFVAGLTAVGFLLRLVFRREAILKKLAVGAFFICSLLVLFMMLNRTAIISAIGSFVVVYIIVGLRLKTLNLAALLFFGVIGFLAIVLFVSQYGVELYRGTDHVSETVASTGSFVVRVQVWINALQVLLERPWYLIFGLGPSFIELGNQQFASLFKMAADSRDLEGALDSTWLTYFIEFGALGFILVVGLFLKSFLVIKQYLRQMPDVSITNSSFLTVFGGLVYLSFAFVTQSLGYAKISWLPFQLVLIAFGYIPLFQESAGHPRPRLPVS
jgi:hypothetical protein